MTRVRPPMVYIAYGSVIKILVRSMVFTSMAQLEGRGGRCQLVCLYMCN